MLEDALLPAEHAMVEMGEQQRVRESRAFMQAATTGKFVSAVESIVRRKVRAFSSAVDPDQGVVWEIFTFESVDQPPGGGRAMGQRLLGDDHEETAGDRARAHDEQAEIDREVRASAAT
jgi:hypothetical protein